MNKNILKGDWRLALRKIRQHWEILSEDEINQIQNSCENHDLKEKQQFRIHRQQLKVLAN